MHSTTSQIRFSWERGFQRENLILSVPLFIFSRRITSYFNSTIHPHANNRPSIFNFRSSSFRREIFFIQSQQFSKTCSLPSQKLIAHEHKNFITKISYPKKFNVPFEIRENYSGSKRRNSGPVMSGVSANEHTKKNQESRIK